jgi:hypothetical protein
MHYRAQQCSTDALFGAETGISRPFPVLEYVWDEKSRKCRKSAKEARLTPKAEEHSFFLAEG